MNNFDFIVNTKKDKPTILQLTDTQIIDSSQRRYPNRLSQQEIEKWKPENLQIRLLRYIDECINQTNPDFIVISGDFCYGEFDDNGNNFNKLIHYFDSFKKPWTTIYGNHERESNFNINLMNKALENSKYCLFKGENFINGKKLEGNGNFSIGIYNDSTLKCSLYMLDSGVGTEECPCGIFDNQRNWLIDSVNFSHSICNSPSFVFMHIPPLAFYNQAKDHGYYEGHETPITLSSPYGFGKWAERTNINWFHDRDGSLFELIKSLKVSGIDVGHFHKNSTSSLYQGVLLTYGLKTGEYDAYLEDSLGGTITIIDTNSKKGYTKKHIYINFNGEICK